MRWTVPNTLTVLRLLAAPGLAVMFLYLSRPWADWLALFLFVGAAVTDWVDGHLARNWRQISRFGTMLDPIADKAMVVIALAVLAALWGPNAWLLLPAAGILFREVFVSGLREYLGDRAGLLKVTNLAKWKTLVQMVAIAVLFAEGVFEHYFGMFSQGMDRAMVADVLAGRTEDVLGLRWLYWGLVATLYGGIAALWVAAILTLMTGWDYFAKARPMLREEREEATT